MIRLFLYSFEGNRRYISDVLYSKVKALAGGDEILKTEEGKPYLLSGKFYFSISHTDSLGILAVSDKDVGVDAESKDRTVSEGVGKRFLGGRKDITEWVHFEAFSKLMGEGISIGYEKMKETVHNCAEFEIFGHRVCVCSFGDITLSVVEAEVVSHPAS